MNIESPKKRTLRCLDAFTGMAGMTIAFKNVFTTVLYCDVEPYVIKRIETLMSKNKIEEAPVHKDIKTLKNVENIDAITAGFPCPGFSALGKREGFKNVESILFFELVRVIKESGVTVVFLENVPGAGTLGRSVIIEELAIKLDFDLRWLTLRASEVGAPHERNRWYCLCIKKNSVLNDIFFDVDTALFPWSTMKEPPRTENFKTDEEKQLNLSKLRLLGNSVVPCAVRFSFYQLLTWGNWFNKKEISLVPVEDHMANVKKTSQTGSKCDITYVEATTGNVKTIKSFWPFKNLKKDYDLVLDPKIVPLPAKRSPNQRHPVLEKPWATPRKSSRGSANILTKRMSSDLPTQVRFEVNTVNRNDTLSAKFVSYLMGYESDDLSD